MFIMSEASVEEFIHSMSAQRVEVMRAGYEAALQAAWENGKEAGKLEGLSEGEFRGRKQGVNLLRTGTEPAVVAKAAELPEPIIRKLAQDNGIELV